LGTDWPDHVPVQRPAHLAGVGRDFVLHVSFPEELPEGRDAVRQEPGSLELHGSRNDHIQGRRRLR